MNQVTEVKHEGKTIAKLIPADSWQEGLSFFSNDEDYLQVGTWSYDAGKQLARHVHNQVYRSINRTHEVLYVRQGLIKATIFSLNQEEVGVLIVSVGDVLVLMDCSHGYEILEDQTMVLEIKNGPYLGAEIDRRRF
ncbi:MAG: hypothetical protein PHU69_06500 [Fermentimonas sp.]|nr:hypothetical protein [Fermentimonas sp.]